MSFDLPPQLRLAADRLMEGVSRKDMAQRAGAISARYRAGGGSAAVIASEADATAYVLTRLPATYAACGRVFAELSDRAPGFAPASLLDAGAGPGGAGWAALETSPAIARASLLDSNRAFLDIAATLAADAPAPLQAAEHLRADLTAPGDWPSADLVVASYALAEIPEAKQAATIAALWASTLGVLAIVEPGTPAGWQRILAARATLIEAGAAILAPCPHGSRARFPPPTGATSANAWRARATTAWPRGPRRRSKTRSSSTCWPPAPASRPNSRRPACSPRRAPASRGSSSSSARRREPPSFASPPSATSQPTRSPAGSTGATRSPPTETFV